MKLVKQIKSLRFFWILLSLIGIDTEEHHSTSFKTCRALSCALLALSVCTTLAVFSKMFILYHRVSKMVLYSSSATMTFLIVSVLCHYNLFRKRRGLKHFKKYLAFFPTGQKTSGELILIHVVTLSSIKNIVSQMIRFFREKDGWFVYCLFTFHSESWTISLAIIVCFLSSFALTVIEAVLGGAFYALCCQWKEAIAYLKDDLKKNGRRYLDDPSCTHLTVALLKKCRILWQATTLLKDTFQPYLFYAFLHQITFLFCFLVFCFKPELGSGTEHKLDFFFYLAYSGFGIYTMGRIPEEMENIVAILNELHEDTVFETGQEPPTALKKYLKPILRKRGVALSIGGIAEVRKTMLIACAGALITYGTLLLSGA